MTALMMAALEVLSFSSMLAASVAGALTQAAAFALLGEPSHQAAGLAFAGTLAIYNTDRLRDLERDRRSSPRRSAFVSDHRGALIGLVALGSLAAAMLAWRAGASSAALCGAVLLPSLLHRRIKRDATTKVVYLTAAWVAVVVGLPALQALQQVQQGVLEGTAGGGRMTEQIGFIACIYAAAIGANLIASNAADEAPPRARAIWGARGLAAIGVLIGLAGSGHIAPLACVPLAQLVSLTRHGMGERWRLIWIDGSLLVGGLAALGLQALS